MQIEGEHKVIALRGIERAGSEAASEDGAMNEIIGMITRDGSLVPYSPTDTGLNRATNVQMVRVHHTSTEDNIIVVRKKSSRSGEGSGQTVQYVKQSNYVLNGYCSGKFYRVQSGTENSLQKSTDTSTDGTEVVDLEEMTLLYGEVEEIVFIGNRMVIKTDAGIESFLWKGGFYQQETDVSGELTGSRYILPTVEFKVRAGIFDGNGDKHKFAQLVRKENPYVTPSATDGPTDGKHANVTTEAEYARSTANMGSDALALLKSIRHNGGITGYVLVAAAYRLKSSEAGSRSQYVGASDIVLLGAPRIFQKEGKIRKSNGGELTNMPALGPYMIDVLDYQSEFSQNYDKGLDEAMHKLGIAEIVLAATGLGVIGLEAGILGSSISGLTATKAREKIIGIESQEKSYDQLLNANNSEEYEDGENKYRNIQYDDDEELVGSKSTVLRCAGNYVAQGYYTEDYREGSNARNCMWIPNSTKEEIDCPSLFGCKYGTYYHSKETGTNDDNTAHYGYRITRGTGNILSMRINSDIAAAYKDEIDELCIFMSPIINPYKTNSDGNGDIVMNSTMGKEYDEFRGFFFDELSCKGNYKRRHSACGGGFIPEMLSDEKLREKIKETDTLYRVKTIDFDEIKEGDWVDIDLGNGLLDEGYMSEQETLKLSDLRKVEVINGHIFGYNERLHIYNHTKSLVQRVNYQTLAYDNSIDNGQYGEVQSKRLSFLNNRITYHYAIVVTDQNGSIVVSKFDSQSPTLNPIISYPDAEAKSIRVIKRCEYRGLYCVGEKTFTPKAWGNDLSAYCISNDLKPINIAVNRVSAREYWSAFPEERLEQDSHTYGKNEIRVSETGSLVFENKNTYKVGDGEIIGLARMTMGLSQDNFGRFPLVIFSTDGIYTMAVDSTGTGVYTFQTPMSRVICTNKNSICELDGAVLFAAEGGLMILTDSKVQPFAHHINGAPRNTPESANGLTLYDNAINHENIVKLKEDLSAEDFVEYIQLADTYTRYLHAINSVLIYNANKHYSYVIDLTTFVCTKLQQQILLDDNDFPKQVFYLKENKKVRVSIEKYDKSSETWSELFYDIEKGTAQYDTETALKDFFMTEIDNAITAKITELDVEINKINSTIKDIEGNIEIVADTDENDEIFSEIKKTKEDCIEELESKKADEEKKKTDKENERTQYAEILQAFEMNPGGEEMDTLLAGIGIKSVQVRLQEEAEGLVDYTEQREVLRQEYQERELGEVDEEHIDFNIGTTHLTRTGNGGWQNEGKGKIYQDEHLISKGLIPATAFPADWRYVVYVENEKYTGVKFDYYAGTDATQCLLQTRAIKLDTASLKSAYRVVLRGTFEKTGDISIVSEVGNRFEITDEARLVKRLKNGKIVLRWDEQYREDYWQWWDEKQKEVKLKDYGIALVGTPKMLNGEKMADTVTLSIAEHYAGLYVFGSLDGEHWILIGGEEKLVSYNRFHDIGCRTHRVSIRYLMVVFAGYLNTDCQIDGLEITTETRYNNKLK